jgi:putative CocE/NonD family hydrolase
METLGGFPTLPAFPLRRAKPGFAIATDMESLGGFPTLPAFPLRRAKPGFAIATDMESLGGFPTLPAFPLRRVKPGFAIATSGTLPAVLRLSLALLFGLFFAAACRPASAVGEARQPSAIEVNVAVPMRDGVTLRADVLRPSADGAFPVLLYRTPYDKGLERRSHTLFASAVERGFAVVIQDVRGRFASGGDFEPYRQEGADGYDTVEWIANRPWCNGDVGMVGLSYPAATEWLAAVENPPHLRAIAPAMTFSSHRNFIYAAGVFDLSWIEWIWNEIAPGARVRRQLPGPSDAEAALASWVEEGPTMQDALPLSAMSALRDVAPFYYEWLSHPTDDPWWSRLDLSSRYDRVHAAVLNLSGWYDESYGLEGATTNFRGIETSRKERNADTALWIGPWFHDEDSIKRGLIGKDSVAPSAAVDYDTLVLDWMDHYLRKIDNGVERGKPVRYYVMGAGTWRDIDDWPPPATRTAYELGNASPGKTGRLVAPGPVRGRPFSAFVADPAHPVRNPTEEPGRSDFRSLAKRKDLLTFDSSPLTRDTEITGPVDAEMFVSCDCRDLDLWVRLYDVAADDAAFNLASPGLDVVRASYREADQGRHLLRPGRIYALRIHGPLTSNLFKTGHRIRVQISASFFPDFSRNLQTGEPEATYAASRKATIRVHHDRAHRSRIILPIVDMETLGGFPTLRHRD